MPTSEARIAANRLNAQKSTGPKTAEGKERSRRNALKHGLTGAGVALPEEDQAEIARRFAAFQDEFQPKTDAGSQLVRRFAFLSVRLERCEKHDTAEVARRVRRALAEYDDARLTAFEALIERFEHQPVTAVRRLQATPEGVDWLVEQWGVLRGDLLNPDRNCWTTNHRSRFDMLLGRHPGGFRIGRIMALSEAVFGSFHHLDKADGEGLEAPARVEWARGELIRIMDVELARLKDVRAAIDHEALAADRAEAVDRALFDPSKEMVLARKYEAATERGMYRALKELRQVEADATEPTEIDSIPEDDETRDTLASNSEGPEREANEAEPEPSPAPQTAPPILPMPRSTGLTAVERPSEGLLTVDEPNLTPFEGVISV